MEFEWDDAKERANLGKHGVSFREVTELFTSGMEYLEIYDQEHSGEEDRFIAIGPVRRSIVLVVYTDRGEDVIRLISARRATSQEARLFWEQMEGMR